MTLQQSSFLDWIKRNNTFKINAVVEAYEDGETIMRETYSRDITTDDAVFGQMDLTDGATVSIAIPFEARFVGVFHSTGPVMVRPLTNLHVRVDGPAIRAWGSTGTGSIDVENIAGEDVEFTYVILTETSPDDI